MEFTTVRELYKNQESYIGKEITVGGWVRSIRDSKSFGFIVLHDGTFFDTLQIVYSDTLENFSDISKLNVGELWWLHQRQSSLLRFRHPLWRWKDPPRRIFPCRKSAILWSF